MSVTPICTSVTATWRWTAAKFSIQNQFSTLVVQLVHVVPNWCTEEVRIAWAGEHSDALHTEQLCEGLGTRLRPYWLYSGLLGGRRGCATFRGAAGLTIECIVVLCLCVSQYIMRVHLEIKIFGVGELLILALRHSTTR